MNEQKKYWLTEADLPKAWYNIQADLPQPLPPVIHPGTMQPIGPDDLAPLFPMALIMQEVSQDQYCKQTGEKKVIAFNLCGHGYFDMQAYDDFFAKKLPDFEYPTEEVERALKELPQVKI